jgi:succinate dehydrogenase/fumarate reductase flavoprotein subunit
VTVDVVCDVLVIGSGAGGLAAAVTAGTFGLDVIVAEKDHWFGGTTALSGGWLWIPCNPLAVQAGVDDSLERARTYLRHEVGSRYVPERIEAFLQHGPAMVDFFHTRTDVRFVLGPAYPDYHPDAPGGTSGGRAICAAPYDGLQLGAMLAQLRPPVREMTLFGLKVGSGPDFAHFFRARRSPRSAWYVARRIGSHLRDVALYGRDVMLMNGNALVGRLAASAVKAHVSLRLQCAATELVVEAGCVVGAVVRQPGGTVKVRARRGVVCAAGGFPQDLQLRRRLYPHAAGPDDHRSLAVDTDTGDGVRLAVSVGATLESDVENAGAWMPVSRVPRPDGSVGTYPHSFDRGKPGAILVTSRGQRFANESDSYHDVVALMVRILAAEPDTTFHIVCDSAFIARYGLGMAKPFPLPRGSHLRSGYLRRGDTVEALAAQAGIDPAGLAETVSRFNHFAREGRDADFGRGRNAYNVHQGDAERPNPCLAPIVKPPFYGVRVLPGDVGTFAGLRTNGKAQVLAADGSAIRGLYAAGSDLSSIFGGSYPGPGTNLGPAMTFGYLGAMHMAALAP